MRPPRALPTGLPGRQLAVALSCAVLTACLAAAAAAVGAGGRPLCSHSPLRPAHADRGRNRDHPLLADRSAHRALARQRPRPRHEPVRRPRRRAAGPVAPNRSSPSTTRAPGSRRCPRASSGSTSASPAATPRCSRNVARAGADRLRRRCPPAATTSSGWCRPGRGSPLQGHTAGRTLAHPAHRAAVAGRLQLDVRLGAALLSDGSSTRYHGRVGAVRSGSGELTSTGCAWSSTCRARCRGRCRRRWPSAHAVRPRRSPRAPTPSVSRVEAGSGSQYDICDNTMCQMLRRHGALRQPWQSALPRRPGGDQRQRTHGAALPAAVRCSRSTRRRTVARPSTAASRTWSAVPTRTTPRPPAIRT